MPSAQLRPRAHGRLLARSFLAQPLSVQQGKATRATRRHPPRARRRPRHDLRDWLGNAEPLGARTGGSEPRFSLDEGDTEDEARRTVTGLTSPTFTYTAAMQAEDFPEGYAGACPATGPALPRQGPGGGPPGAAGGDRHGAGAVAAVVRGRFGQEDDQPEHPERYYTTRPVVAGLSRSRRPSQS